MNWVELKYAQTYKELNFERLGLFRLIRQEFGDLKILYPGSSIHITPSFYFSDVLYLDRSETSRKFFDDMESVSEIVQREKQYKKTARIRFMAQDFNEEPFKINDQFELLISLFAGDLIEKFLPYLNKEAYILTADTFSNLDYMENDEYPLEKMISTGNGEEYSFTNRPQSNGKPRLTGSKNKLSFKDDQTYYLFKVKTRLDNG